MNKPSLLPLDDALLQLLSGLQVLDGPEMVSTFDADGRILSQDILAELNVPSFDNSAMDGYAFNCDDWLSHQGRLTIGQRIPAGSQPTDLLPGHAARIFTGAPIPNGANAVVMQEECEATEDGLVHADASGRAMHTAAG